MEHPPHRAPSPPSSLPMEHPPHGAPSPWSTLHGAPSPWSTLPMEHPPWSSLPIELPPHRAPSPLSSLGIQEGTPTIEVAPLKGTQVTDFPQEAETGEKKPARRFPFFAFKKLCGDLFLLFSHYIVPNSLGSHGSLLGFSVHGILQARILEWVPMPSSRGSSQPRDRTCISCVVGGFFTTEPPGKSSRGTGGL